jgi:hypothetical protein
MSLPTPPFSGDKRPMSREEETDLEMEIKELKRTTVKYGILTPPSSSVGGSRNVGDVSELFDPFNAKYDEIEVESASDKENSVVQPGRPLTHPKARQARMNALSESC